MSSDFGSSNPYASPALEDLTPDLRQRAKGKVAIPAIVLMIVGTLGLVVSLFNAGFALTQEVQIDPNAPPLIQGVQQGFVGPFTAAVQSGFALLNLLIIIGAMQMLRMRFWGFAVAASIMAMLDFSSCCCLIGLPVGIWTLVILFSPDVKDAFATIPTPLP
jgi:hypothetical protein